MHKRQIRLEELSGVHSDRT